MGGNFNNGRVYENVYFIFIDASGHSNIVSSNTKDVSETAFDLMYEKISGRLNKVAIKNQCDIALIWSWLGDGGVIAVHDNKEQTALLTVFNFLFDVLHLDLTSLQLEFANENINGELHIRIAVTKGTIRYTTNENRGFIHSSDINRGAHLEKATIIDSVAISKEIYDILQNDIKSKFVDVGKYEDRDIFVYSNSLSKKQILLSWRVKHGFESVDNIQCYLQRISQKDKAELIDLAEKKVIDFGTTLNTCSNYLYSTERPLFYKNAVCRLLKRGGSFICYMLEPNSSGTKQLIELRKEDTNKKLNESMDRFRKFKSDNEEFTVSFKVYQCEHNPNLAAMVIDPDSENAICLYSPYLNAIFEQSHVMGRADMPHYLVSKKNNPMYEFIWEYISAFMNEAHEFL